MSSIIVGGGKIGYYVMRTLHERGVDAVIIERNEAICTKIAEDLDVDVICGDGTDMTVLKDAGIGEAEIVAAVTGTDEENLVICEIAKTSFSVPRTIARVNNPKNIAMFKALGIDKIVCSTEVIANLIENELDRDDYHVIQTFERGAIILVEVYISEKSPWCGKQLKNLELPGECVIATILRAEKIIYPRGETDILCGDKVLLLTNQPVLAKLRKNIQHTGFRP
jgi:trk system potassium uptake protein TrkA